MLALGVINGTRVADAGMVASVHTVFNLASTAILLPFSKRLLWLTELTVKKGEKTELQ